ncbi:MAG TPA: ABC transporter permease [Thermomicrobiaceae bacterium]|nr:ABC transporter permease [Thermomicrobiaceae bacterium]
MGRYVVSRLIQAVVLLFLVTVIMFALIHLAPGGPTAVMADQKLPAAQLAQMRANLGLDKPVPVQYGIWLNDLVHGNFGISYTDSRPVLDEIGQRLPNTLILAGTAFIAALIISLPLGIYTARHAHTFADDVISGASFIGLAIPVFWFGIVLIIVFSVALHLLPSSGMYTTNQPPSLADLLKHLLMPALVLATPNLATFTRFVRASVIEVMNQDYVRTARAKGLGATAITYRHVLRNALIPIVTIVGLNLPIVIAGASVTESVFGWPGMGRLAVDAAFTRDYPVVMGITVLVAAAVIAINLVTDLTYVAIDPRVRLQ